MSFPETNPSLLIRLRDGGTEQAWFEFVQLYRPAIMRLAERKGLQQPDCEDLAQNVLVAVAHAITRFEPDGKRARFRTWLSTIANRQVIDALRRRTSAAAGGTSVQDLLVEQENRRVDSRLLRLEVRRQALLQAAARVRDEFPESAWSAFWLMTMEGLAAVEVAQRVGKTVGAVYAAKARIMRRLIDAARELEREFSDVEGEP